MRDHVIVCGLQGVGLRIVEQLHLSGTPVLVVDDSADSRFAPLLEEWGVPHLRRTAYMGDALLEAGLEHALAVAPVPKHLHSQLLRTGTFESKDGHEIGEIVAYRGDPSWVFMSIRAPGVSGTIRCRIEMENGQTEAAGTFVVENGVGYWARPIAVDVDRIRGATLVTSQGSALATASVTES